MRGKGCEVKAVDKADQPNESSTEERGQRLEFPEGMLSYCTWAQDAASTQTQKENRLVGGLKDHRYLPVTRTRHRGASGQATKRRSNGSQRYVLNHRQAGTIGS